MADDAHSNPALDAFLTSTPAAEAPPPAPPAPPPEPKPELKSAPPPKPREPEARQSPPADAADDDEHDDGSGTVPIAALRKTREDYKVRAARAEGELAAMRAQLEAATRTVLPPPPPEPPRLPARAPNPRDDPEGYHLYMQSERINDKLHSSEAALRRAIGRDAVKETQDAFRAAAAADETLWGKLYAHPDPYEWAHEYVQQQRAVKEIGTDPAAYRAKLEAEIEARLRAELGQAPTSNGHAPPVSPAAGIPPSLANVRSSAPRGQTFSGPPDMTDIVGRRSGDIFVRHN